MSGRAAPHLRSVLAGLVVAVAAFAGTAAGQSPLPPVSPPGGPDELDAKPPLPPEEPKRPPVAAEFRYPNPNARIYHEIKDGYPLASEKQNRDEYQAWTEAVGFTQTKPAAGLEQHGVRDLTAEDLVESTSARNAPRGGSIFRLDLVRFDGKLTKVRRIEPTKALADRGVKNLYEGWLTPVDESQPVCVVFGDLPAGLEVGEQADKWVSFAGYFFKTIAYPGPDADVKREPNPESPASAGWLLAPLLVGRSVTLLPGPPEPRVALNKNLRIFRRVRDDHRMQTRAENWEEYAAWARVALHARKFPTAELERAARRDLGFADLFREHRLDHQLELVYVEGRLISLRRDTSPPPQLAKAGVSEWYEGWLVPKDEAASGHPVCIAITELPDGLEPQPAAKGQPLMNRWVGFAGYSFKLMRYESREPSKDKPAENVWKRAPLLIGRSVTLLEDPAADLRETVRYGFVVPMVGLLAAVVAVALGLGWYFRRGDRRVKAEVDARTRNPFGEPTA